MVFFLVLFIYYLDLLKAAYFSFVYAVADALSDYIITIKLV